MSKYKILKQNDKTICIMSDNSLSIPLAKDNTDYQEYLKWLAEGNIAEEVNN